MQRWLRAVATVTCLAVFAYLAIDPDRHVDVVPTLALALGAVLLLLGYESVVRIPGISRGDGMIARPVCLEPVCKAYAVAPSRYCEEHRRAVE